MTGLCSIHLSIFSAEGPNKTPWGGMKVIREVGKKGMGARAKRYFISVTIWRGQIIPGFLWKFSSVGCLRSYHSKASSL